MIKFFDRLYCKSFIEFCEILKKNLKANKKMFVVTANPESFMIGLKDSEVEEILLDPEVTMVPDGIGIVRGAKILGYEAKERIPGVDLATFLLEEGNRQKKSIYLFGASEEVSSKMEEKVKQNYPNLHLLGRSNGYISNKDEMFEKIKEANPDIILVALGIPAQEKLIFKHFKEFKKGIFIGVGGSFDVMSGVKKRAPKIFQKLGLEWFYRIMKEPKRIKRFSKSNVKFILEVKKLSKKSEKMK